MRIAVVITTYGNAENVVRLLGSLASGERLPDEVVVVDNATRDLTSIYRDRCLLGDRMSIIHLGAGLNVSAARNAGAKATMAEIVLFVDDDNVADPGLCARLMELFESRSDIQAAGPLMRVLGSGSIWCAGVKRSAWTGRTLFVGNGADKWNEAWANTSPDLPNCFAVRHDTFNLIGGFNELFPLMFEESDFGTRLLNATGSMFFIETRALVYHDVDPAISIGSALLHGLRNGGTERVRSISRSRLLFIRLHSPSLMHTIVQLALIPIWVTLVSIDAMRQPGTRRERARAIAQLWIGIGQGARQFLPLPMRVKTSGKGASLPHETPPPKTVGLSLLSIHDPGCDEGESHQ